MVTAVFKPGMTALITYGLKQYDRGQVLEILGIPLPDLCQIHIAALDDKRDSALVCLGELKDERIVVDIPDELLTTGYDLAAYIYAGSSKNDAETVKTVFLPVDRREKPEIVLPEDPNNLLGILLDRLDKKADNLELEDGWLQLLSGKVKIGDRIRLPSNGGGSGTSREIELKNDGKSICWRYTDSNEWVVLVALDNLKGKDGETPEFEIRDGHLYAVYKE